MMKFRAALVLPVMIVGFVPPVWARFLSPRPVPVERLLKNAEANLIAHGDSAEAHYLVARIHYLAFARGSASVPATSEADAAGKPAIPSDAVLRMLGEDLAGMRRREAQRLAWEDVGAKPNEGVPQGKKEAFQAALTQRIAETNRASWRPANGLTEEEIAAHAVAALTEFRAASKLAPKNGLYALGLASLIEQVADWKAAQKPTTLPADLIALDAAKARGSYLEAFRLSYPIDSAVSRQPVTGLPGLVSYEAGSGFVRLAERESAAARSGGELEKSLAEVQAGLKKIASIPRGAITPMILALHSVAGVSELLAPETVVDFDLRGYGPAERWPWVKPNTALLVWDPERLGEITSGQQLFGGYTFQLFRANGYDALAALDDDGDGVLRDTELVGIRAWFDTNSDGRSAPGEVSDLAELGIVGVTVRATSNDGPHLKNPRGLILRDGATLPTWDWMAEPVQR